MILLRFSIFFGWQSERVWNGQGSFSKKLGQATYFDGLLPTSVPRNKFNWTRLAKDLRHQGQNRCKSYVSKVSNGWLRVLINKQGLSFVHFLNYLQTTWTNWNPRLIKQNCYPKRQFGTGTLGKSMGNPSCREIF